jgi:MuDR family transposase/MULE transposase domain/SWIM zinc finger
MFPVSIYTGGAVETGPMGATYNKPPSASYPAQDDITFHELKAAIFQLTGINEDKFTINVNARWNAGAGGSHCFVLLPVCDNSMWRMLVEKTLSGATGWSIVELFINTVPNSACTHNDPKDKCQSNVEFAETPDHPAPVDSEREVNREEAPQGEEGESQELTDEESFDLKPCDESTLYVGRLFDSLDDLKQAVREYHIRENRKVVTENSSNKIYVVKCDASTCGWRLYAARCKDGEYFQIKTIKGKHVCSNEGDSKDHRNMSCEFISKVILDLIRKKGDASPKEIQAYVHDRYPCTPSYSKAWRAKELAKAHLFGEWKESYTKLAPFLNAIQVTNPGTKVEWWSDGTADPNVRLFKGVAWAFAPAIEGFKHCRPVISIDSTILCGKYGGRMLLAVAYDADGQVLPLAFAVIKVEDDESWSWFMRWLRAEVVGPRLLCVISDWQNSILRLFDQPNSGWYTGTGQAFHRYCTRYLCESIRSAFKKDNLVKLVRWVSRQNQRSKFRLGMMRIMETNREAYNWLVKLGALSDEESAYHLWSLCEDGGYRYGIMAANGNECVFNIFPNIQDLPITALVELTFTKSAELFASKKEAASKIEVEKQLWSNKVSATLEVRRAKVSQHQIVGFQPQSVLHDEVMIETRNKAKHTVRVGSDERSCSCQKPQLTGIPCSHLLAVCALRSFNSNHLVDAAYDARQLLATWTLQFHRPGSPDKWPDYTGVAYSPDCNSVKRGRRKHAKPSVPAKLKKSGPSGYRCSLCREIGHRKERCLKNPGTSGSS